MLPRALVFLIATNVVKLNHCTAAIGAAMVNKAVDFEVFGKVQGVFFRKFTKEQADKLGVRGWCMNTAHGTVQGQLQGSEDNIQAMMNWLKSKGSPASEIERAEFRNQQSILELTFNDFTIRRE